MKQGTYRTGNGKPSVTAKCLAVLCVTLMAVAAPVSPVSAVPLVQASSAIGRPLASAPGLPLSSIGAARVRARPALIAEREDRKDREDDDERASSLVRFLQHATFGPSFGSEDDPTSVEHLREIGVEDWLDEQFNMPTLYESGTNYADLNFVATNPAPSCDAVCQRDNYSMYPLQIEFYRNALTGSDQLRQRVAFALSQVFVVSAQESILNKGSWMTPYLQTLDRDAFGNFRNLLRDITLNPAMGSYLNMLGNTRAAPNENYAREVLQLFTIGLNQLNIDGSPQLDARGQPIPTYTQDTVTNFARVFTGWNLANPLARGFLNYRDPMVVHNEGLHDRGPKHLLRYPGAFNDGALGGGMTAESELEAALDNIFNHPNVGPFIGKILIQHLVTSNPSPEYVARVASAFNESEDGVRGDMQAVIRAILLDREARHESEHESEHESRRLSPNADFGHLLEPVLFITNTLRAFGVDQNTTDFVLGESFLTPNEPTTLGMGQDLFRSPSVFNYYPPGYPLAGTSLKAPEFALLSTASAFARINLLYLIVYHQMPTTRDRPKGTWLDLSSFTRLAKGQGLRLIRELNFRLLHGAMSDSLRDAVLRAISEIPGSNRLARVQEAVYLVATSPEFQVGR